MALYFEWRYWARYPLIISVLSLGQTRSVEEIYGILILEKIFSATVSTGAVYDGNLCY